MKSVYSRSLSVQELLTMSKDTEKTERGPRPRHVCADEERDPYSGSAESSLPPSPRT